MTRSSIIKHRNNGGGFTLVELTVVMVILGILAALALPKYIDFTGQANAARADGNAAATLTRWETLSAPKAASTPLDIFPTLNALVGLPDSATSAVPAGWTNNTTPTATATPTVVPGPGTSTYAATDTGGLYGLVPRNSPMAPDAGTAQAVMLEFCLNAFGPYWLGIPSQPMSATAYQPDPQGSPSYWLGNCVVPYGVISSATMAYYGNYTCPLGGNLSLSPYWQIGTGTCTVAGSLSCPAGYALSNGSCALSNATQVACPSGYTSQNGGCYAATTSGLLPLAANGSGVCVGPNSKAATWADGARSIATTSGSTKVAQVDVVPTSDPINCPATLFP